MEVILLEKVGKLGDLGEKVNVKAGFGRNFLVPQGKAVPATKENVAHFESRRAELEAAAAERLSSAQKRAEAIAALTLTIEANAGDEGKLFGSIGTRDVADCITKAGVEVGKAEVRMPEGVIRETGEYQITIHLHSDVDQEVTVTVVPE